MVLPVTDVREAAFASLKSLIFDVDFAGKDSITESEWNSIGGKFAAYKEWMAGKKGAVVESLGLELSTEFSQTTARENFFPL